MAKVSHSDSNDCYDSASVNDGFFDSYDFYVGSSIGDGHCFFDSFRQSLKEQKDIDVTIEQLRMDCLEFASTTPEWFISAIQNSYDDDGKHTENIDSYIEDILGNRWGDPDIEGRILCKKYDVKLHVAERHTIDSKWQICDQLIDNEGSKNVNVVDYNDKNILHIINQGNAHFEPLLNKQIREDYKLAQNIQEQEDCKFAQSLQDREFAKTIQVENVSSLQQHEINY
ncbi:OTU domain-containing protein [Wolbachia endosymbiont of Pentidionis agamae]|uniref:hypothetical protein n=1 Tax=Wolbachia endosymbiont of Pentidionis agamae TaxID=3110435 RepID=UPI002FD54AE4